MVAQVPLEHLVEVRILGGEFLKAIILRRVMAFFLARARGTVFQMLARYYAGQTPILWGIRCMRARYSSNFLSDLQGQASSRTGVAVPAFCSECDHRLERSRIGNPVRLFTSFYQRSPDHILRVRPRLHTNNCKPQTELLKTVRMPEGEDSGNREEWARN
jgi:hypothetical protein